MRREDYRATVVVMVGLGAATLTGFLRQAVVAQQLGAGRTTDIYLVAFAVPEFVFIALPIVLAPAFMPLLAACRQQAGEGTAWRFAVNTAVGLALFLAALTLLAEWGAPLYLKWLAPGFSPTDQAQTLRVTRLMLLAISLMGLATLFGAILQTYRRFARSVLSTALYNLVFIGALWLFPAPTPLERAAWGVTLGAGAALIFQLPIAPTPAKLSKSAAPLSVWQVAQLAGPLAAGYAAHHLILFVDRGMATTLGAGSAAVLDFANRLALAVGQLSGLAVSTALFPKLAEQIGSGDLAQARKSLASALRLVWAIALPASAGLVVLRTPLVRVLFERGAFDAAATTAVSAALVGYALAVLADAVCQPLWRIVYAQQRAWTVLWVNSLQTGLRVTANIVLSVWLGYVGLALSAALGLAVQAGVLAWLVQRRLGTYVGRPWWQDLGWITLASAAATVVAGGLRGPLASAPPAITLMVCGVFGGLAYLIVLSSAWLMRRWRDDVL